MTLLLSTQQIFRTRCAAFAQLPPFPTELYSPQKWHQPASSRLFSARRFARGPLLTLGVLGILAGPKLTGSSSRLSLSLPSGNIPLRAAMSDAAESSKPLTSLLETSKAACDSIGILVRRFYLAINSDTSTLKADKSVFTIADGIVQELLSEYLFAGPGKFSAIVGEEEESNVNIKNRPYFVDNLKVPPEFEDLIDKTRNTVVALGSRIPAGVFSDLTVFIDPIDGTREFSTGKGTQSSICIGFAGADGRPVAGLVYRPIPTDSCDMSTTAETSETSNSPRIALCTWAAGAASEACAIGNLDSAQIPSTSGFLTTNGAISKFTEALMEELRYQRVPAGGAGNKMLMLLEGKGAVYIQDRGVSRWDTCGAQAVIEAYGGTLCRLDTFLHLKALTSYTYKKSETNADFVPALSELTAYNARDPKGVVKGAPPIRAQRSEQVKIYANLNGLFAVSPAGIFCVLGSSSSNLVLRQQQLEPRSAILNAY